MNRYTAIVAACAVLAVSVALFADGPAVKPLYGTVVSVDAAAGKVVIKTMGDNPAEVTVATDSATKITVADKAGALGDLKPGMVARILPPTGTASEIRAFIPKATTQLTTQLSPLLYGKVVSVDAAAGNLVITTLAKDSKEVTVATDADTKVFIANQADKLANLKPGMVVRVLPATGTATEIRGFVLVPTSAPATQPAPTTSGFYGTVVSVDGTASSFVVKTGAVNGKEVTVATDANTTVNVNGKAGKLADIKAGMRAVVKPATGTATNVYVYTPKTPPAR